MNTETRSRRGRWKIAACVLLAAVALLLIKKVVRHWTGITACTLILSGGIGNIIDRIVHHGRLIEFTGPSHRIGEALMFGKNQPQ